MRIDSVQVENYKSFYVPTRIHLTPGFNVVIGQNNVGKTALLEALSLRLESKPHRSQKTVRTKNAAVLNSGSQAEIGFELESGEIPQIMRSLLVQGSFYVKQIPDQPVPLQSANVLEVCTETNVFNGV